MTLDDAIESFITSISRKALTPYKIAEIFQKKIKNFGIGDVVVEINGSVLPNDIAIMAEYDEEVDEEGGKPFYITLIFHGGKMKVDSTYIPTIRGTIKDALIHEGIHRDQARSRDFILQREYFNKNIDKEYLGNEDEIGAYARNIADEISRFNKEKAVSLLRDVTNTANLKNELDRYISPSLYYYMETWNWDMSSRVIKRLLKKVYKHILNYTHA